MNFIYIMTSLRKTFEARASEWALSIGAILWGLIVLSHPGRFESGNSFLYFLDLAPQVAWGFLALTIGAVRLVILFFNGTVRKSPHLRMIASGLTSLLWLQIVLALLAGGDGFTGLAMYPVAFGLDVFNVMRAAREAGLVDRKVPPGDVVGKAHT